MESIAEELSQSPHSLQSKLELEEKVLFLN